MRSSCLFATASLIALGGCSTTNSRVVTKLNADATLAGNMPVAPLQWRVITSGVDRHNSTMFTVFGNDAAVQYSRNNTGQDYPAGSAVALATWHQQEDIRWFGGKIPARAISVEFVSVKPSVNRASSQLYRAYEGSPLSETTTSNSQAERRAAYILSLRAAVMP